MISTITLDALTSNTILVNPVAGNYNTPQTISFTAASPDATIYYTVDGSTPTTSSLIYTTGLPIWSLAGKTIKVYSVREGFADSPVTTLAYSYQPLKTRQSTSYITGDDASANQGVSPSYTGPSQHSTFTNDYTTTDNTTGLIWKSCSEGQSGSALHVPNQF